MKKCSGVGNGLRNIVTINLIRSFGCFLISLAVFVLVGGWCDTTGFVISLGSGVSNAIFLFAWLWSAEKFSLCLVEIFCMIGSVFIPLAISPLLYSSENISWFAWVGALLLFFAVLLFVPKANHNSSKRNFLKFLPCLVLAAVSSAATVITQKLYVTYAKGSIACFNLLTFFCVFVVFFLVAIVMRSVDVNKGEVAEKYNSKILIYISLAMVMLYLNQYLITEASRHFSSAIFYPLSYSLGMPLTFLADMVLFKEKLTLSKCLGLIITVISIIFIFI